MFVMNERTISLMLVSVLYRYFGIIDYKYPRPARRQSEPAEDDKTGSVSSYKSFSLRASAMSAP